MEKQNEAKQMRFFEGIVSETELDKGLGFDDAAKQLRLHNDMNIPLGLRMREGCYEIAVDSRYLVCTRELYLERSREIQGLENEIKSLKKLEDDVRQLQAVLNQTTTERDCAWQELDRLRGSMVGADRATSGESQESEDFYRIQFEMLKSENEVLKEKLQKSKSDNSSGEETMRLRKDKEKLEHEVRQKDNKIKSLLNSISALTKQSSSGEKQISPEIIAEIKELEVNNELVEAKKELAEAKQTITSLENRIRLQAADIANVESLKKELAESKGEIKKLDTKVKGYSKVVARNKSIELRSSKSRQTAAKIIKYAVRGMAMKEIAVMLGENENIRMKLNSLYRLICVTEDDSKEKVLSLMKEFPNEFEGVSKEAVIDWFNKLRAKKLHLIGKDEIIESYGDEALTIVTNSGITSDKCVEDHYSAKEVAEVIAKKVAEEEAKVDEWGQPIEEV